METKNDWNAEHSAVQIGIGWKNQYTELCIVEEEMREVDCKYHERERLSVELEDQREQDDNGYGYGRNQYWDQRAELKRKVNHFTIWFFCLDIEGYIRKHCEVE